MPFKPGDICITDIQYTADCYVITEAVPGGLGSYYVLSTRNRTTYIVAEKVLHKISGRSRQHWACPRCRISS
jgi:hypothetical protein